MKSRLVAGLFAAIFAASLLTSPGFAQIYHPPESSKDDAVNRALESVNPAWIEADLRFIADDEMQGRDTVSQEQRIAARYIRARLERIGFQPGAGEKYLYQYPLEGRQLDRSSLAATLTMNDEAQPMSYGSDYVIAGRWAVADLESSGDIVYCGAGTKEDFDPEVMKGRWALCHYSGQSIWRIFSPARQAGAIGLIVITDPESEVGSVVPHFKVANSKAFDSSVSWPSDGNTRRQRPSFPILAFSDTIADTLLKDKPEVGTVLNSSFIEKRGMSGGPIVAENVCGLWPGSDPVLKNEVIIVSAHYDHIGASGGQIFNGADDNGSGTSGMLALAEALVQYGPMKRSVLLIWVSGEEKGLWGSRAWSQNPSLADGMKAVANINIDMIGRNDPKVLYVTPSPNHKDFNGLTKLMETFGAEEGFGAFPEGKKQGFEGLGSADDYYRRSDHAEFAKLGIPVCFLFAGVHDDYHKHTDTIEKIDYDKIHRVVRVVIKALNALQADELNL
jgi:hypothetical protein